MGRRLLEVVAAFLKLGLTSFGGPIAHLGYLREEFVVRRRWLEDAAFGDLVALCQFLPGPASSQTVYALGMHRAGFPGAIAATLCFTLPSAAVMIAFGYGVTVLGGVEGAGWLHGLKLAAVAVVAQAVWGMGRGLCTDRARVTLCLAAAAALLAFPGAALQVGLIAAGAVAGWLLYRKSIDAPAAAPEPGRKAHVAAVAALVLFAVLLAGLPIAASASGNRHVAEFDSFYRSGSLVFGGGHVVLPLLRAELVPRGWLSDDRFLAGYAAAQAIPGPLFTFSGYLGTVMHPGRWAWLAGVWCLVAVFLPGYLLIGGTLPFWNRLRARADAQAALRGANAAVVGVLLAALYNPVFATSVKGIPDVAAALAGFGLLQVWRVPPWVVVLLMAAAGQWVLR